MSSLWRRIHVRKEVTCNQHWLSSISDCPSGIFQGSVVQAQLRSMSCRIFFYCPMTWFVLSSRVQLSDIVSNRNLQSTPAKNELQWMSQMCCLEESIVVFAVEIHQEVDVQQDIIVVLDHQFQLLMIVIYFMWVMLVRLVLVWIRPQLVILVLQVIIVQKDHHLLFNVFQVPTQVLCEFDCPSCTCVKGYLLLFFEWYSIGNSSMFDRILLSKWHSKSNWWQDIGLSNRFILQ
jgi:hypothetical protein